jgi:hypothetical protein
MQISVLLVLFVDISEQPNILEHPPITEVFPLWQMVQTVRDEHE